MEVLVEDLCKRDVVAAIAKRRIFFIKDKPNLTPEIWERFRAMIPAVHHTQPVDPLDLEAKLRDCAPRTSEPPDSAGSSRTPSPPPDDVMAEQYRIAAKEALDTLIQLGGRPTAPIQSDPRWRPMELNGVLCFPDTDREGTMSYDLWYSSRPNCKEVPTEACWWKYYWDDEMSRCENELRLWQQFRDNQQLLRELRPDRVIEEETERQRYPQDPHLTASLKKIKDWKEYQGFIQRVMDKRKRLMDDRRRTLEAIRRGDPGAVPNTTGKRCRSSNKYWLMEKIISDLEWLPVEGKRLEWAKQQLLAVLAECAASLEGRPTSLRLMEERSELEAKRVFNDLVETGGKPTRAMRPVPDCLEHDHADQHLHACRHWEGEYSQFEEEWRPWKKFLDYRQQTEADGRTEVQPEAGHSAENTAQIELWKDYWAYQQLEVDNANQWVEFWQRHVEENYDSEKDRETRGWETVAHRSQSFLDNARKQVRLQQMRLEWVEQQLSALLAASVVSTTESLPSDRLDRQSKMPKSASRSGQTSLKDLRSDRSDELAPRSNHGKKNIRASANSMLDPIHSSRISKVNGRKGPRLRGQSKKTLTKYNKSQTQGPHTATSPPLFANIVPRRSSRLSNNGKRSGTLEANLAAGPGNSTCSPLSTLRRSDRISKQRERSSTSTSNATASSAMILQAGPSRRLSQSKPKGRRTGNKSDASSGAKPRGISKRPQSKSLRTKTKTHN
ncbi:MAG: hypothetical protein Q9207_001634 [Kuettlingeria erythrocarpa]